jgi:hypothetical protein
MVDSITLGISERSLVMIALFFLFLVIVGAVLISPRNKLPGRGKAALPMKSLGHGPILQVELARRESDLEKVLATGDVARNLKDACVGNKLDTYLFIPAYAGLLISIGLLLARGTQSWTRGLILLAVVAVPVAAICDWTENAGITACLDHFKQDGHPHAGDAVRISRPSFIKWTLLAVVLLIYGLSALGRVAARKSALGGMALIAVLGTFLGGYLVVTLVRYLSERGSP